MYHLDRQQFVPLFGHDLVVKYSLLIHDLQIASNHIDQQQQFCSTLTQVMLWQLMVFTDRPVYLLTPNPLGCSLDQPFVHDGNDWHIKLKLRLLNIVNQF